MVKTIVGLIVFWLGLHLASAQQIVLRLLPSDLEPLQTEFKINEVIDLRIDKSKIGEVFNASAVRQPISIQGNLRDNAIHFYQNLSKSAVANPKPIEIRIYEVNLTESFDRTERLWVGEIQLLVGFFVQGASNSEHLVDYSGKVSYRRNNFTMNRVEQVMNRLFYNSIVYFQDWYQSQAAENRSLAKTFRLEIIEPKYPSTTQKRYYDPSRPLTWDDFQDVPNPTSRFNATIFANFSMQGVSLMESGSVVQTLEVEVHMVPRQSWVKEKSDYGLNHEQRHFDLVRIIVNRMIDRLEKMELSLDWYQATINQEYLATYREMNRIQEIYDGQTRHGLDREAQARWNEWIDRGLAGDWSEIEKALAIGK